MKEHYFQDFLVIFLAVLAAEFAFKMLSQGSWPPLQPSQGGY